MTARLPTEALLSLTDRRIRGILSGFAGRRLLVLGDLMVDQYVWGTVSRISPEAPVPVVEINSESMRPGGAGNVAINIQALGAEPYVFGVVGEDESGQWLRQYFNSSGIATDGVLPDPSRPTTTKTRVIAHSQQVVRVDRESRQEIPQGLQDELFDRVSALIPTCDAVVISDYAKGVVTPELARRAIAATKKHGVLMGIDPKVVHLESYRHASIVTPNQHEAAAAYGRTSVADARLVEIGWALLDGLESDAILITRAERGMSLFERKGVLTHLPTVAREVYDVTGAGDTVISALMVARAAGATFGEAAFIANHAAGIVVGKVGTATATREELARDLSQTDGPGNLTVVSRKESSSAPSTE